MKKLNYYPATNPYDKLVERIETLEEKVKTLESKKTTRKRKEDK